MSDREITAEMLESSIWEIKNLATQYFRKEITADQMADILRSLRTQALTVAEMVDEILDGKLKELVTDKPATFNID